MKGHRVSNCNMPQICFNCKQPGHRAFQCEIPMLDMVSSLSGSLETISNTVKFRDVADQVFACLRADGYGFGDEPADAADPRGSAPLDQ